MKNNVGYFFSIDYKPACQWYIPELKGFCNKPCEGKNALCIEHLPYAEELRKTFEDWAEDWNDPKMNVYNDL